VAIVLVTGGSGTLGSHVVSQLRSRGHEVRVLSRRPDAGTHVGDLTTGDGVDEAVRGAQWVVHAASDTRRFGRQDLAQTRHLLDAAGNGVEHLLYVSIVGIDAIPYAYYRRKLQCEEVIDASPVPSTVLRATQFHELLAMVFGALQRWPLAPLPAGFRFQTVAAREVASRLTEVVEQPPVGRAADVGGPEVLGIDEMADTWRAHRGRPRRFFPVPIPGRVAEGFKRGRNTCPGHRDGQQTWEQFVQER
jgi:uncharacterized protein YbjT (DUF2867 family)